MSVSATSTVTAAADSNSTKSGISVSSQGTEAPLPSIGITPSSPDVAKMLVAGMGGQLQQSSMVQEQTAAETSVLKNNTEVCLLSDHYYYLSIFRSVMLRCLRLFGHIVRSDSDENHTHALNAGIDDPPTEWRCPHPTWLRTVENDLNNRIWGCGLPGTELMTGNSGVMSWKQRRSCRGMLHDDDYYYYYMFRCTPVIHSVEVFFQKRFRNPATSCEKMKIFIQGKKSFVWELIPLDVYSCRLMKCSINASDSAS